MKANIVARFYVYHIASELNCDFVNSKNFKFD